MTKDFGEVLEEHTQGAASFWESVLRQLPAAAAVVDAESGRVVLASGRAEEDGGTPGLPGAGPGAALRPDGAPFAAEEWPVARSLRAGDTVFGEEVAFRREDGSTGVYLLRSGPVRDADGRIVAAVALWTEVTGARRAAAEHEDLLGREREARDEAVLARTVAEAAQQEAQAADTAKSSFLASMSHEIRTPINAIMGYTDLLDLGLSGPVNEAQHGQLARIRDSSRHLLSLVNEVLDVAKIDAGEMEVDREPGRLAGPVDAALDLVRPQAAERGLQLPERCEGDPEAVFVGDEGRVRQIAANLLSNAVKFTPAGGRVRVSCGVAPHPHGEVFATHAGPWAFLAVEDNGIGIAPEVTARIFEPFVQADEGRTRRAGGTGLGLTISRKLARLMKGDLTVRSRPGEGSTFTLWLPAAEPAAPAEPEPAPEPAAAPRVRGIAGLGMRMLDEVDSVCQSFVLRLRAAPPVPHLDQLPDSMLRNHFAALVTDAVQCLVVLEESPDDVADLMQDGSAIQRTIADRHGIQRFRLRWTEEGVREDYRILIEEVEACARSAAADVPDPDPELALSLLRSFMQQAVNISIRAFRIARRAEQHPS
jgi:signal transduction histidine kinase